MSEFYLLAHKNPNGDHFYRSRNKPVLAVVVHITAGLEDMDGVDDQSAEKTAAYAASTDRAVSWHSGSDADNHLRLLPDEYTAFQCRGYNSVTVGHEISKRSPDWRVSKPEIVERLLVNAALTLKDRASALRVPPRKASKAELDAAIAEYDRTGAERPVGFVGHWELDPSRRQDPGLVSRDPNVDTFPWARFLTLVTTDQTEDDMTPEEHTMLTDLGRNLKNLDTTVKAADGNNATRYNDLKARLDALEAKIAQGGGGGVTAAAVAHEFSKRLGQ